MVAAFKSESPAGFRSESPAGFVGIRRERLIELFLWYGVLGFYRGGAETVYIYSVNYNFGMLRAIRRKEGDGVIYAVNPAFRLGLGTRGAEMDEP